MTSLQLVERVQTDVRGGLTDSSVRRTSRVMIATGWGSGCCRVGAPGLDRARPSRRTTPGRSSTRRGASPTCSATTACPTWPTRSRSPSCSSSTWRTSGPGRRGITLRSCRKGWTGRASSPATARRPPQEAADVEPGQRRRSVESVRVRRTGEARQAEPGPSVAPGQCAGGQREPTRAGGAPGGHRGGPRGGAGGVSGGCAGAGSGGGMPDDHIPIRSITCGRSRRSFSDSACVGNRRIASLQVAAAAVTSPEFQYTPPRLNHARSYSSSNANALL